MLGLLGLAAAGPAALAACAADEAPPGAASPTDATRPATGSASMPNASVITRWDTDPWALGSYSAIPTGTSADVRSTLADLVIDDRIVLAGEYTATDFPSTVHGAYNSGRRAADVLIDRVGSTATVLVVGAGMAGLAAAQALRDAGCTVVVAEARDRIGGRIWTDTSWGYPLELGAAWLHGVGNNPVVALAEEAGLTLVPTDFDDAQVHSYLTGDDDAEAAAAAEELVSDVETLAESEQPPSASVADALAELGWRADSPDRRFAASTEVVQEYGLDLDALGAQALTEGEEYRGGDSLVAGGFIEVPRLLAAGLEVRLGTAVAELSLDGVGVRATLSNGGDVTADAAVVAVPVAMLQRGQPKLALPDVASRALAGLATGNLEKAFLRYSDPWWPQVQVLQVSRTPADRWTEFYDLQALVAEPVLVGFAGGRAATTRPSDDAACAREAADAMLAGYGGAS